MVKGKYNFKVCCELWRARSTSWSDRKTGHLLCPADLGGFVHIGLC